MDKSDKKIFGLRKNVFFLGLVSLFNDFSNEMIQSVMPLFLTSILGNTAVLALGIIEGVADALSSFVKVASGVVSDRVGRRKPFAILGYSLSVVTRPFLGLASAFSHVFSLRLLDRFGKGLRDAPRDALLASSVKDADLGKSFGYQRSMDALGGLLGPLAALAILPLINNNFPTLFIISFIIGLLALGSFFWVREIRGAGMISNNKHLKENLFKTHKHFTLFIIAVFVFGLGILPIGLILFRVGELGLGDQFVPLLYFIYGLVFTLSSAPLGRLSDRVGPVKVIVIGFILAITAYIILILTASLWGLILALMALGVYSGATDGIQRALAAKLMGHELLGAGEGILQASIGLSSLFAGTVGGLLWFSFGHAVALSYVVAVSASGLVMLLLINRRHKI
ncbi:MAG TPA: MFS transporter [Candidatus Paceibacterota bacterium]